MRMRVLITGIAGFIGSHVADRFLADGHSVCGLDDLSTGKQKNTSVNFRLCDISSFGAYTTFRSFRPEVVIHLAAQPSLIKSRKMPHVDANTNIIGTLKTLENSISSVNHFIFASTSAVYDQQARLPIKESSKLNPTSNYGTSKLAAEFYVQNSGIPCTILRFGNVYGPRQVPLGENQLIPRLLSHIYQGRKFSIYGDGEQVRDYVYVTDVAEAIYSVVTNKTFGIFNVSTGIGTSTNDVANIVKEETGYLGEFVHTEARDNRDVILSCNKLPKFTPKVYLRKGIRLTVEAWKK